MTVQYRNEIIDSKRYNDIDRAKGLAIMLVVIGHLVSGEPPVDHQWFLTLKSIIYKFHMSFFMYLSGLIFGRTYKIQGDLEYYKNYLLKKVKRLLPGYLIIAFIIFFGKISASAFLHVDNVNNDIVNGLADIFLRPSQSVAGFLWYVYVLLELYLFLPLIFFITRRNIILSAVICGVLHISTFIFDITNFLMINSLLKYSLPFVIGILAFKYYEKYVYAIKNSYFKLQLLFICSFIALMFNVPFLSESMIGLLSIPALHSLMGLPCFYRINILIILGKYTFTIYLLNTIMIGITKGIFLKFLSWNGVYFYFFLILSLIIGIFGPIIIYRLFLINIPFLKVITK